MLSWVPVISANRRWDWRERTPAAAIAGSADQFENGRDFLQRHLAQMFKPDLVPNCSN